MRPKPNLACKELFVCPSTRIQAQHINRLLLIRSCDSKSSSKIQREEHKFLILEAAWKQCSHQGKCLNLSGIATVNPQKGFRERNKNISSIELAACKTRLRDSSLYECKENWKLIGDGHTLGPLMNIYPAWILAVVLTRLGCRSMLYQAAQIPCFLQSHAFININN